MAVTTRATPADLSAANAADRADSISWARLSAGDLPAVVAQLRAGGIPPRYLRVILEALVAERFADRHKAIVNAMTAKPWWQGLPYESITSDPKIAALGRQLSRDERALLYQLIGPEPPATDYDRAWAQRKYGDLTPDKIEQVSRINRDYTDLMAEIRAQAGVKSPHFIYLEQFFNNNFNFCQSYNNNYIYSKCCNKPWYKLYR